MSKPIIVREALFDAHGHVAGHLVTSYAPKPKATPRPTHHTHTPARLTTTQQAPTPPFEAAGASDLPSDDPAWDTAPPRSTPVAPPAAAPVTTQGYASPALCPCGVEHTPDDAVNIFGVVDAGPDDDPNWDGPVGHTASPPGTADGPSDDPAGW